ncbi:MAG: dienelactone hydrolase family protein [Chloroflexi bacterium]|nr:dienelactone hydrolase family protein [Chloroflexota bacterium]
MANPLVAGGATEGADVQISSGGDSIDAYFAKPAGGGARPGVVVIHENRGLVPYLREVADGLASSGYLTVAPDLLTREGGTASIADVPPVLSEIPRERHTADALAAIQFLKDQGATKIGIIGFCFGGAVAWRAAVASADLAAVVPFYGSNPPLEGVSDIKAAVFAVYGGLDERVNAGIDDMMAALKAAGTTHDHKVFDGAQHAFHNHTNAERHNAAAANDAWADTLAWFDKHLK